MEFRPATPEDRDFLLHLYGTTREEELAAVAWSPEEKAAFLRMQFEAQDHHYRTHYPGAEFLVMLHQGQPAGRLYVWRGEAEIRVMDIALLPELRNLGLGHAVMEDLLRECTRTGRAVRVHVEKFNPALRFYERLGFRVAEDRGVYWFLEWLPGL